MLKGRVTMPTDKNMNEYIWQYYAWSFGTLSYLVFTPDTGQKHTLKYWHLVIHTIISDNRDGFEWFHCIVDECILHPSFCLHRHPPSCYSQPWVEMHTIFFPLQMSPSLLCNCQWASHLQLPLRLETRGRGVWKNTSFIKHAVEKTSG